MPMVRWYLSSSALASPRKFLRKRQENQKNRGRGRAEEVGELRDTVVSPSFTNANFSKRIRTKNRYVMNIDFLSSAIYIRSMLENKVYLVPIYSILVGCSCGPERFGQAIRVS